MLLPSGMNTYAGIIVAILPSFLNLFGLHATDSAQLNALINDTITFIGTCYAFYGRMKAETPGILSKNSPTPPAA